MSCSGEHYQEHPLFLGKGFTVVVSRERQMSFFQADGEYPVELLAFTRMSIQ